MQGVVRMMTSHMEPLSTPLRIRTAEQTCDLSPTQYEGFLDDGRFFYLRYSWGELYLGIGNDLEDALGKMQLIGKPGEWGDGVLFYDEIVQHTAKHLDWSNAEVKNARTSPMQLR